MRRNGCVRPLGHTPTLFFRVSMPPMGRPKFEIPQFLLIKCKGERGETLGTLWRISTRRRHKTELRERGWGGGLFSVSSSPDGFARASNFPFPSPLFLFPRAGNETVSSRKKARRDETVSISSRLVTFVSLPALLFPLLTPICRSRSVQTVRGRKEIHMGVNGGSQPQMCPGKRGAACSAVRCILRSSYIREERGVQIHQIEQ